MVPILSSKEMETDMNIIQQPPKTFYRYSPKKTFIQFVIGGPDIPETCTIELFYEAGGPEEEEHPRPVLKDMLESVHMERNQEKTRLVVRCRLNDISKNHMRQKFVFGIHLDDNDSILFTTPVEMLSKETKSRNRLRNQVKNNVRKTSFRDIVNNVEQRLIMIEKLLIEQSSDEKK